MKTFDEMVAERASADPVYSAIKDALERLSAHEEALRYAISVIEAYEFDVRSRQDLVDAGFCQGELYKRALARIEELRNRQ